MPEAARTEYASSLSGSEPPGNRSRCPICTTARPFHTLDEGIGYAQQVGFDTIMERGREAAEGVRTEIVYAGFSLGVMPAQMLAQTRPGAKGALLFHACIPTDEFGSPWPLGVPVQIHAMEKDELLVAEGDLDAARELVRTSDRAKVFLYPGDQHLFTDESLPDYDEGAATALRQRVLSFLDQIE